MSEAPTNKVLAAIEEDDVVIRFRELRTGEEVEEFSEEAALAVLLANGVVFLNSRWARNEDKDQVRVFVNCNDVFAWAFAEGEDLPYDEIRNVYEHWRKDPSWGPAVWCMKRRGMLPQRPVYERIKKQGIWDLDRMGLRANWYDGCCEKLRAERGRPIEAWENEGGAVLPEREAA